jgi:WS/DGAT/MGAT family acyltransferase
VLLTAGPRQTRAALCALRPVRRGGDDAMSDEIEFPRSMGSYDTIMWRIEDDPVLRATAAAVTLLARNPRRAVLEAKLSRATELIPRLRQRVVELPRLLSNPVWAWDPDFDLSYHLRWMRAPGEGTLGEVLELAASLCMQGFDRDRPLWEFAVVEDLEGGRAALIQKLHHAVTDGVAGLRLMQKTYDREAEPPSPAAKERKGQPREEGGTLALALEAVARRAAAQPAQARRLLADAFRFARHPLENTRQTLSDVAAMAPLLTPSLEPLSPILRQRSSRYRYAVLELPLAGLKAAGRAARCKINDAFLAAVTGGFRRYHERHGAPVEALRASVPISLRAQGGGAVSGNAFSLARFCVPLAERDPKRRMRKIRALVERERARPAGAYLDGITGAMNLLPAAALTRIVGAGARGVDFIASCVPGLPVRLYLAGAPVEAFYTFGPTVGTAVNATLFSYLESASVAINADPAAVPDPALLLECMSQGFDEVLKVG